MIALHPPRPLPPPDPRAVASSGPAPSTHPDLFSATPWWARVVLPRRIPILARRHRSAHPRLRAGATTALLCIAWGCLIGGAAGATAGTLIVPLFGTLYGGFVGAPTGAVVGAVSAPITVAVLAVRHGNVASPHAVILDTARVAGVLPVLLGLLGTATIVAFLAGDTPLAAVWATAVVVGTIAVVVALLRVAVLAISLAWCRPSGWERA